MRKAILVPAAAAAATIALAGCHGGSTAKHHVNASVSAAASQDAAKEQKVINTCLAKGTLLTKTGRKAFESCASAGIMTPAAFESCATKQLTSSSLLTKTGRTAWLNAVEQNCVVAK